MTNAEALNLMMARLGGRSDPALRARMVLELNVKVGELERGPIKPWFLESEFDSTTVPMVASQAYVDLPSNFLMEIEDYEPYVYSADTGAVTLKKVAATKLRVAAGQTGIPEVYALHGNKVLFGPTPDSVYTYTFPCYVRTAAIADDAAAIASPWLVEFFNYITLETCMVMASEHIQSAELMQKLTPQLAGAKANFVKEVEARIHANRTYLVDDEEN